MSMGLVALATGCVDDQQPDPIVKIVPPDEDPDDRPPVDVPEPTIEHTDEGFGYLVPPADFAGGPAWTEALSDVGVQDVAPLSGDEALVIDAAGQIARLSASGLEDIDPEGLLADTQVRAVTRLSTGQYALATADGLWVLDDDQGLERSPLTFDLWDVPIHDLLALPAPTDETTGRPTGSDRIWLITDGGLFRWADDQLEQIALDGLMTGAPVSLVRTDAEGRSTLWLAGTDAGVVGLLDDPQQTDATLTAWTERADLRVAHMAADGDGALWVLDEAGRVHRRDATGSWQPLNLADDTVVAGIAAAPSAAGLWLWTASGQLWHLRGEWLREIGAVEGLGAARVVSDGSGRLLVGSASGLARVHPGLSLSLSGIAAYEDVEDARSVAIRPTFPEQVVSLEVQLDQIALSATPPAMPGDAWRVELDPFALQAGGHELFVTVDYGDDVAPVVAGVRFLVGDLTVTWSAHVRPLFEAQCMFCHNDQTTRPLNSPQLWRDEFDLILTMVDNGAMPIGAPPLAETELALIRRWQADGFPE